MRLGGDDDYDNNGRFIPTTAVDQCNASLANWFGVESEDMSTLFPNLGNFASGDISTSYLNFI
ncbi:hypothetical protein BOW53_13105 [Solemya pervernicosa gill symbiont]|uniref:Uncharacterized protein n=2 Tax=Gammaproteobacteria incertae sedis TaxID=118884 RepID=A0A1T2L1U4_9GAMM|nr:hypothetical protein [Candidatus Reidiella endopervernicosa]OOZ39067.1 hypothetical protein BOW53_13105 [Solemya pervernicosa gill symbiont]QKQ25166.1 hypothetical protein HUE57_01835 [Candidatus Reidiella endopervernicosa]